MLYQFGLAFAFAAVLMFMRTFGGYSTVMNVPFLKQFQADAADFVAAGATPGRMRWACCPSFIFVAV